MTPAMVAELVFAGIEIMQIQAEGKEVSPEMWAKIRVKMEDADAAFDAAVAARNQGGQT